MGDLIPMRQGLDELLADLERLKHGRAPQVEAVADIAPAVAWPETWGPEHVTLATAPAKFDHGTLDLVRARGRSPWAACGECVEGWLERADEEERVFSVPCRCMPLRKLVDRINRADLPAAATLDDWRLETIDWVAMHVGGKARVRDADNVRDATVREAVEGFVNGWRRGRPGLLIAGPNGNGKSHLAAGIARTLLFAGVGVRWVAWTDYLARIKATFGDERPTAQDDVRRAFVECELLVLEELGAGQWTEWVGGQAEELIYQRHQAGRTTVVTTNLTLTGDAPGSLVAYVGERARSRLIGSCDAVKVTGTDWRTKHLGANGTGGRR